MERLKIRVVGHSGYGGLLSTGSIIAKALERLGFYVVADREYPSLIKGGTSCFTINASRESINSLSATPDILVAIDKPCLMKYFPTLADGGTLVHGYERLSGITSVLEEAVVRNVNVAHLNGRAITHEAGGSERMKNVVLIGMLWKVLGLPYETIADQIKTQFARKPNIIPPNLKCAKMGYERTETQFNTKLPDSVPETAFMDGNYAIALGAIHAGVRAYYAYPMSPSTHLLTHMANHANEFGYVVKQAEDEITVANLALGSMHAGTRALCATSGGGFDLMTETVSLSGIIETPFVCCLFQRPGPATGLPTWTGQGDLNLAMHGGHGEFARMVIAASDPTDHFELIQHALNFAEEFQMPVILLSDKVSAEQYVSVPPLRQNTIPIKRGLVDKKDLDQLKNTDRYEMTESGLSKRWLPGESDAYYFANGDEHNEEGILDEDESAGDMYAKRMRKLDLAAKSMPEPVIYGDKSNADISFVGWGSTKGPLIDAIKDAKALGLKVNYLHFSFMWPLKTKTLNQFFNDNSNVHLAEGNYTGQLGNLIEQQTQNRFKGRLLKWNGRPFFSEDLAKYINDNK
jgi:2-oxoglutarate ferredoxin oxidoreductase subunit alpha